MGDTYGRLLSLCAQYGSIPVVCNVLAAPIREPAEIRQRLVEQVTGTVRWRESVLAMVAAGVTNQVELGAGKVLTGLARRIDRGLNASTIGNSADVTAYVSQNSAKATE